MKKQKGYTLIETVVVSAIIAILIGAIVMGVGQYLNYAHFKKVNAYAETLFTASQMQLTKYSESGALDDFKKDTSSDGNLLNLDKITTQAGKKGPSADEIWGDTDRNYQGSVHYLKGTADDYAKYRTGGLPDNAEGKKLKALYDLFDAYLYDKTILDATICVEYDPNDGLIYSVLYNDKADNFTYVDGEEDGSKLVAINDRQVDYRKERMTGYYGVENLSKSTSRDTQKPVISKVALNNESTLNLTYSLTQVQEAVGELNYEVIVYGSEDKKQKLSIEFNNDAFKKENLDTANYRLVASDTKNATHTVEAKVTKYDGDNSEELGMFTFPAYIDQNKVTLVLDAADSGATEEKYIDYLKHRDDQKYDNRDMGNTFSLHRFGLEASDIYCTVQGSGSNYKATAVKQSNVENAYFAGYTAATNNSDREYTIENGRHLYNIRFIEACREGNGNGEEAAAVYTVSKNFSWEKIISDGAYYRNQDELKTTGNLPVPWVTSGQDTKHLYANQFTDEDLKISLDEKNQNDKYEESFPSIRALRDCSVLRCADSENVYAIKDIKINEKRNQDLEITGSDQSTGLFLVNDGRIENIDIDNSQVKGTDNVGTFCGVNNKGSIEAVSVLNTDKSTVKGETSVGGIFGLQSPDHEAKFSKLLNRAEVTGHKNVGGITGSFSEGTISASENYGQIKGDRGSENVGGITGLLKGTNAILDKCNSSPQYSIDEIVDGQNFKPDFYGKYVGGIVGYNDGGSVTGCNTRNEKDRRGYVVGDTFVGGIIGYNNNSAGGDLEGTSCVNQANVLGNSYVGGIVGANCALTADGKVKENYDSKCRISNWSNNGAVLSKGDYAGGITGYNSGDIVNCDSNITMSNNNKKLVNVDELNGDYVGGIAGRNSGKIYTSGESKMDVNPLSYGRNYVGGVAGYNSRDALVEDQQVLGGYISGNNFVGGFIGMNLSAKVLSENTNLISDTNDVSGQYCVAGIIGANIIPTDDNLEIKCNIDNALGKVNGKEYVGGFFGYNVLLKDSISDNELDNYLSSLETSMGGSLKESYEKVSKLNGNGTASNGVMTVEGTKKGDINARRITGSVLVGGVIGYNDENTCLYINSLENRTTITATDYIILNLTGADDSYKYSLAGGITGIVEDNVIIDSCKNGNSGKLITQGTFTGGLAEVNMGLMANCTAENMGESSTNYIGGIAGLNYSDKDSVKFSHNNYVKDNFENRSFFAGNNSVKCGVYNCELQGSITGDSYTGGLIAVNEGTIYNPKNSGSITVYGKNGGGTAGYNGKNGNIVIKETQDIDVKGRGSNVGGIVGYNEGSLSTSGDEFTISENSSISGKENVGGVIGVQNAGNTTGFSSAAKVTASAGNAGGIVGVTDKSTINGCLNMGTVQSQTMGSAGGIVSDINAGSTVKNCWNAGNITSLKGESGGIAGCNRGTVNNCNVSPVVKTAEAGDGNFWKECEDYYNGTPLEISKVKNLLKGSDSKNLTISANSQAGAVVGQNTGKIKVARCAYVSVSNQTKSDNNCNIGGITGSNSGSIELSDYVLDSVNIKGYTNKCNIGGIVGFNSGSIDVTADAARAAIGYGSVKYDAAEYVAVVEYAGSFISGNIGGAVGRNGEKGTIRNCRVSARIKGFRGDSSSPTTGYGGIAGLNNGDIEKCTFNGELFANGNSSAIACTGGIAGVNNGTVKESVVGTINDGRTVIQCGTSNNAYGYTGGLIGLNNGTVQNCDNAAKSKSSVYINNYAGHTGGIIGKNSVSGSVKGTAGSKLTSGSDWQVLVLYYDNDCGAGGIMGYSASAHALKNVENHADLYFVVNSSNVATGGFIGRLENNTNRQLVFNNCGNYGNITSIAGNVGGFVGRVKYSGITVSDSVNYGNVGTKNRGNIEYKYYFVDSDVQKTETINSNGSNTTSGGFVGTTYEVASSGGLPAYNVTFENCYNHGTIEGASAAGFITTADSCGSMKIFLTDCVNTGCILGTNKSAGIANATESAKSIELRRCRNYGLHYNGQGDTKKNFSGLYNSNNGNIAMNDCFDISNEKTIPVSVKASGNIRTSYYYNNSAKKIEKKVYKTVKISDFKVGGPNYSLTQASYELNKMQDGNADVLSSNLDGSSRITTKSTNWSDTNNIQYDFKLQTPENLKYFGIRWGHNGIDNFYRQYTYKLFYKLAGSDEYTQITGTNTEDGEFPVAYDGVKGVYTFVGGPDNNVSTAYHPLQLQDDTSKVESIRLVVTDVRNNSTPQFTSSSAKSGYVIIGEVYPTTSEYETKVVVSGGSVETGILSSAGNKESDGYTIVGEDGLFKLKGLKLDPSKIGYLTDFSTYQTEEEAYATGAGNSYAAGTSPRYRQYYDIERAIKKYFKEKYKAFDGTITVAAPTDAGNSAFDLSWTTTREAYAYEVSYKITDSSGKEIRSYGDEVIKTPNKTETVNIGAEYAGCKVTFAVRAVYYDDNDKEKYSQWFESSSAAVKKPLPVPVVHFEFVQKSETQYGYKAILDNYDDYKDYNPANITINTSGIGTNFKVSAGESPIIVMSGTTGNVLIRCKATDSKGVYGNSLMKSVQTLVVRENELKNTDYAKTTLTGFCGKSLEEMYYSVTIEKAPGTAPETYYNLELLTDDDSLNSQVAVSSSESHVTGNGNPLTASLSNLPGNLMEEDRTITIRSYPWRSQAYMTYFGHNVAFDVEKADLKGIKDNGVSIWADDDTLKPGYVIQETLDGKYTVIYDILLDKSDVFAPQIDSITYKVDKEKSVVTNNLDNKEIAIAPYPVIENNYDYANEKYTFKWDTDKNCKNPEYYVVLIGIKNKGTDKEERVEISSGKTTDNHITLPDDVNLDYQGIELSVERYGKVDSKGITTEFPSVSTSEFQVKERLEQVTAPTIDFHSVTGKNGASVVEKNDMTFDITWNKNTNSALDHYELNMECNYESDEKEADGTNKVNNVKIVFNTGETTGKFYLNGVEDKTVQPKLLSEGIDEKDSSKYKATVNIDCLAYLGGEELEVSVRSIARDDFEKYRSSVSGVKTVMEIPKRLDIPDLDNLEYVAKDVLTLKEFESSKGVEFNMSQNTYKEKGNYEMVIQLIDKDGNTVNLKDSDGEIISKDNPIKMTNGFTDGYYNLKGISAEYAGCKVKVILRAVSEKSISSVWTDNASNKGTKEAVFVLPKVQVDYPVVKNGKTAIEYSKFDSPEQHNISFDTVDYADEYLITFTESKKGTGIYAGDSDDEYRTGKVHFLRLKLNSQKNGYDTYYSSTDSETYGAGKEVKISPIKDKTDPFYGSVILPYKYSTFGGDDTNLDLLSMLNIKEAQDGKFNIEMLLPDCDGQDYENFSTQCITVQAVSSDADRYTDSQIASWYRDTVDNTKLKKDVFKNYMSAPEKVKYALADSKIADTAYEITAAEDYFMVCEVTGLDKNGKETGDKKLYSMYGYGVDKINSLLLMPENPWKDCSSVKIRTRYITANMGLSDWSEETVIDLK